MNGKTSEDEISSETNTPKEKLWNANYCKAMAANFLLYFAFYILTPLLPLYLSDTFGATKDVIGIVLSGYTLTALLFRPFSGFIVDTFDRKRALVIFFAIYATLFFGYVGAGTLLLFAIVRTLHGAPFGGITVANSTVAIDVLPSSRRNEGIGYYGLSNNLSMAIAPTIGLYLYHLVGSFQPLFWTALVSAFLGLAAAESIKTKPRVIEKEKRNQPLSLDRFFLTRAWLMAINIALFSFCFGVLSNYLAIYSKEALGITGGTGTYFALLSIGLFSSRLYGAKALREGRITHNASEGMCVSLTGYTLFALLAIPDLPMKEAAYYLSALLIGLGNGHMYPAFLNMFIGIASHNERGTANSTILTAWDTGMGIGIIAGGFIAEHAGYPMAFATVAAINLCGVLLYFSATKQKYLALREKLFN